MLSVKFVVFLCFFVIVVVVGDVDQCFTGEGSAKSGWTKDSCASGWCLKLAGSDDVQDHRQCDTSGVCPSYGSKCGPPVVEINNVTVTYPAGELCCCEGNLCNGSTSLSLSLLAPLSVFIQLIRFLL